jgi:hypothetical protein
VSAPAPAAFVPGRREAWLTAGAVIGLAVLVRAIVAARLPFPVPEDTAYYAGVARNLVEGRGLVSDALWSYQTAPLEVPRAAFEVWLPLPSLLAAPLIALAGTAGWFRAAQVVSVAVSSIVAALGWRMAADVATELRLPPGRARTLAAGTGLVCAVLGPLVVYGALPDSTALFAALSLAGCLLMNRIRARTPQGSLPAERGRLSAGSPGDDRTSPSGPSFAHRSNRAVRRLAGLFDRRLVALGLIIGLAGLTRSEAVWLVLAWALMGWFWVGPRAEAAAQSLPRAEAADGPTPSPARASARPARAPARPSRAERLRLVAVPALVALLVFAPWAIRDWLTFGTPLPGQTLANALSIRPTDIYAYQDQPTLARYLAQGPVELIWLRVEGIAHNLFAVLIVPGFPIGLIGLLVLPRFGRLVSLRPLVLTATLTFLVASLVFPVSTTWGTFLHAAGAIYVLLTICCLLALDALIAWVHRIRHWWRPVAWLGPTLATAVAVPLMLVSVGSLNRTAAEMRDRYDALPAALERAGMPLARNQPVVTDNPIWLAETAHVTAIALPEESPDAVVALADRFGARLLVVEVDDEREWPAILARGGPGARCFEEVPLVAGANETPGEIAALTRIRAFRIVCP